MAAKRLATGTGKLFRLVPIGLTNNPAVEHSLTSNGPRHEDEYAWAAMAASLIGLIVGCKTSPAPTPSRSQPAPGDAAHDRFDGVDDLRRAAVVFAAVDVRLHQALGDPPPRMVPRSTPGKSS